MRSFFVMVLLGVASAAFGIEPTLCESVPMSDGTKLTTDVYLPQSGPSPFPTLLVRSIYGRDTSGMADGPVQMGYAIVMQDVRGMGRSEGEKALFKADGWRKGLMDGADTVAWIRAQPWCNGKIGTWGSSALGITGILLAPTTHDVTVQYLEGAPANLYEDMVYQGGVFRKSFMNEWLPLFAGVDFLRDVLKEYKSHPTYDEFWSNYNVKAKAKDITAPAMFVTGWYDFAQQGVIDSFVTRETEGGPGAKGNNYLIIRWGAHVSHNVCPDYVLNANRFQLDVQQAYMALFGKYLGGVGDLPSYVAKVNYYVLGADTPGAPGNEWRKADMWPPFPTETTAYYLRGDGALSTEACGDESGSLSFSFDPNDPFPTLGGANMNTPAGPFNQRPLSSTRTDLLKFSSAPLTAPMEITGRVTVRLFVSSDAPDTDFTAKLVDVYPSGDDRELLMLDSIRRVKTRLGYDKAAPLLTGPDEVVELDIDLQSISWIFAVGHRISLHISSSNYPRFEVNPNTGADFPSEGLEMRIAHNTVHMAKARASAVILPVRPAASTPAAASTPTQPLLATGPSPVSARP